MENFANILIGIATGLVATWAFWKWLLMKKPNIVLSDNVAVSAIAGSNHKKYSVKIVNKGNHQVIDITLKA